MIRNFCSEIHVFFSWRNRFIKALGEIGLLTQEANLVSLIFLRNSKKTFVCTLEVSHGFLLLIRFSTLIMKNIKFSSKLFFVHKQINEQKKLSFVLHPRISQK